MQCSGRWCCFCFNIGDRAFSFRWELEFDAWDEVRTVRPQLPSWPPHTAQNREEIFVTEWKPPQTMVFHIIKIASLPTSKSLNISACVIVGRKMFPPQGTSLHQPAVRHTKRCLVKRHNIRLNMSDKWGFHSVITCTVRANQSIRQWGFVITAKGKSVCLLSLKASQGYYVNSCVFKHNTACQNAQREKENATERHSDPCQ